MGDGVLAAAAIGGASSLGLVAKAGGAALAKLAGRAVNLRLKLHQPITAKLHHSAGEPSSGEPSRQCCLRGRLCGCWCDSGALLSIACSVPGFIAYAGSAVCGEAVTPPGDQHHRGAVNQPVEGSARQ